VPPGDRKNAEIIRDLTLHANLCVSSYGSYYRVAGGVKNNPHPFSSVLQSALDLGAPVIRVWAGVKSSVEATEEDFQSVILESRELARRAGDVGVKIAFELHGGTLTEEIEAATRLLEATHDAGVLIYWQKVVGACPERQKVNLRHLLPYVANIHVFQWFPNTERHLLREGIDEWSAYFSLLQQSGKEHWALLEFVRDDAIESFSDDAKVLIKLLKRCAG